MIFKRLFQRQPKWRHSDPRVRQQALAALPADDPVLIELARTDADAGVRRAALERLDAPELLLERVRDEAHAALREVAAALLRALLAGRVPPVPPLERRLALLPECPPELFTHLALEAAEPALRLAAVARLDDPDRLATVALSDAAADVRLAAAERIHDASALERLARDARGHDKRVHRLARERLDAIVAAHTQRQRCEQLCAEIEALAAVAELDAGRLLRLEREWGEQAGRAAYAARFEAARAPARAKLEAQNARLREAQRLQRELGAAHERLARGADVAEAELERLEREARAAGAAGPSFLDSLDELRAQLAQRRRAAVPVHAAAGSGPGAAPSPTERPAAVAEAKLDAAAFEAELAALETALEAGELAHAEHAHARLAALRAEAGGAGRFERRLHAAGARLQTLRGWRRWGGSQAREHLCDDAERLAASADAEAPDEIAHRVRTLREAWKRLDRQGVPAPQALWERFDRALETAYAPCREHFAARAEARAQALAARTALCQALERLEADTDWHAPDWRTVERHLREAVHTWREAGPVDRTEHRALERRFSGARAAIERRLDAERSRERARREALIARLAEIAAGADLRAAIAAAKEAQAEWPPTVQLARAEEQALWLRLRAVCDEVFARREAERHAHDTERETSLAEREALCDELEALATLEPLEALLARRAEIDALEARWDALGPAPRAMAARIERRHAHAWEALLARLAQAERVRARRAVREIAEKAALCARVEALALTAQREDSVRLRAEWDELAPLAPATEKRLTARLAQALAALDDPDARARLRAQLAAGAEARARLCLRLEVLAGLEPPSELARDYLELQVSRLSASLNGAVESPDEAASAVIADWYCTAAPADPALDTRFAMALVELGRA